MLKLAYDNPLPPKPKDGTHAYLWNRLEHAYKRYNAHQTLLRLEELQRAHIIFYSNFKRDA